MARRIPTSAFRIYIMIRGIDMKIRVYLNEKKKLMCSIPGEKKDVYFAEFYMAIGLLNKNQLFSKFGETMPEIDVDCELDPSNKNDAMCIALIDEVKKALIKIYGE